MKRVPKFKTEAEADAFLEQDLSGLDFKRFVVAKKRSLSKHTPAYRPAGRSTRQG